MRVTHLTNPSAGWIDDTYYGAPGSVLRPSIIFMRGHRRTDQTIVGTSVEHAIKLDGITASEMDKFLEVTDVR